MSSPGFDALTLEIPRRLLAERATVALVVACVLAIEIVATRYPEGPVGAGLVAGMLLLAWDRLWVRRAPRVEAAGLDKEGRWLLRFSDGSTRPGVLARGSRVLGSSVVLRWRTAVGVRSVWLTRQDLDADRLRQLTARLLSSGARTGA